MFALRIIGSFGAIIALPVVLLAYLGTLLDARYHTKPLFLGLGFALAALFTGISVYRKAKTYGQMYADMNKKADSK